MAPQSRAQSTATNPDSKLFLELRSELTKLALVFKAAHLPFAQVAVNELSDFLAACEDGSLSAGADIDLHCRTAVRLHVVFKLLSKLFADLGSDMVSTQQKAAAFHAELELEKQQLIQHIRNLKQEKEDCLSAASIFAYNPLLNLIAVPACLTTARSKALAVHPYACQKKAIRAAVTVHELLISSCQDFVDVMLAMANKMADFAGLIMGIKKELDLLKQIDASTRNRGFLSSKAQDRELRFMFVSNKVQELAESCAAFSKDLPIFTSITDELCQLEGHDERTVVSSWLENSRRRVSLRSRL